MFLRKAYSVFVVFLLICTLDLVRTLDKSQEVQQNEINTEWDNEDIIGNLLAGSSYSSGISIENPEEQGPYVEGDIIIPKRNGIVDQIYRWPSGIVPYEIKGKFTSNELSTIRHAINEFHGKTCIRFRPRANADKNYISIMSENNGCWSSIGRLGGRQEINLQSNLCLRTFGTPIHELMHAIGFFHEQNRHERDSYVRVLTENIKPGMIINFQKYSPKTVSAFGIPYDYGSVLHYSPKSFSINGKPTLLALFNTSAARYMGQRNGFSSGDIAKINAMYRCNKNRN